MKDVYAMVGRKRTGRRRAVLRKAEKEEGRRGEKEARCEEGREARREKANGKCMTYSSQRRAIEYPMKTSNVNSTPASFPFSNATPRNDIVLPQYIGASVTLNGNPVTGASMRMPK